jgi:arylsulfatase A-like enzyme
MRPLLPLLAVTALTAADPARPNMLVVFFDDLNTTAVSCYGQHPGARTPTLDRLAARGVRFANAQSNAPICGPSRASLITGLLPSTSGYFGWRQQDQHWRKTPALAKAVTMFEQAKRSGYHLYGCGKIYHSGHDEFGVFSLDGSSTYGPKADHGPFGPAKGSDATDERALIAGNTTFLKRYGSFGPLSAVPPGGWSLYSEPYRYRSEADRDPMPDEANAAWTTRLIQSGKLREPFLLVVGINRPHSPETAPDPYFDALPLDQVSPLPLKADDTDDVAPELRATPASRGLLSWTQDSGRKKWQHLQLGNDNPRRYLRAYLACTSFADAQFGRIIEALDASPYAARTWTIATSDHGFHLGEKGHLHKNTPWEESCRVPFIISGPGVSAGGVCPRPMSLVDLYPTLVDLGGWKNAPRLDGHSLLPLARDPAGAWNGPDTALSSVEPPWDKTPPPLEQRRGMQNYSLRSERWRYIRGCLGGEELYDHQADPHEWTNLAGKPEHAATLTELRAKLLAQVRLSAWPDPASVPLPAAGAAPGMHD